MVHSEDNSLGKVLFVDDKDLILQTVSRFLEDAPFKVLTAESAVQGLEIIEKTPVSMVVSDYKMPNIDGLEFLKTVKTRFPDIRRAMGTGYMDELTSTRSIDDSTVSTFFPKPWNFIELKKEITHILKVQQVLQKKNLLETLNEIEKLPTLPKMYQKFMEAMDRGDSAKQIAEILEQDVAITTNIIRLANSSFFGTSRPSSLKQAIMKVGFHNVKSILFTIALTNQLNWSDEQQALLQEIFKRAAIVNYCFLETFKITQNQSPAQEDTSLGLLFNIGHIIVLQYFFERYRETLDLMHKEKKQSFYEAELELGFEGRTHSEIGAYLLQWWDFPQKVIELALFHHAPEMVNPQYRKIAEILEYAEELASTFIADPKTSAENMPKFSHGKIDDDNMEELKDLIVEKINEMNNNYGYSA
jgi:HD-like signal output (HDOD) protein